MNQFVSNLKNLMLSGYGQAPASRAGGGGGGAGGGGGFGGGHNWGQGHRLN